MDLGTCLVLGCCQLFNEDPRSGGKACVSISQRLTGASARADSDFHFHISFFDSSAVTFNMTMFVFVEVSSVCLVQCSIDRTGRLTFLTIEREIPTITALVAPSDPDVTRVVHMKGSVAVTLFKLTFLLRSTY